ncbi:MAG TPA: universal stress protein [Nakamurella sp.]|nr:universal stress protein [Nakamurella sp.]
MPVVVGVDGSDPSTLAVRWAARAAARSHLPLSLVHAVPPMPPDRYAAAGLYVESLRKAADAAGERVLGEATKVAVEVIPGQPIRVWSEVGHPVEILARASATAHLVAIGATGHAGLVELLAGSTALELPARAHSPVVVVRSRPDGSVASAGPVVVGVAGAELDDPAVEFAFAFASREGAELVAVHSWSDSPLPDYDRLTGLRDQWDAIFERERRLLAERMAGYRERYPDVPVRPTVVYDRPARALLAESRNAQLVVVGTRGRGILAGALLGSTSRAVVKASECPVAVLRRYS